MYRRRKRRVNPVIVGFAFAGGLFLVIIALAFHSASNQRTGLFSLASETTPERTPRSPGVVQGEPSSAPDPSTSGVAEPMRNTADAMRIAVAIEKGEIEPTEELQRMAEVMDRQANVLDDSRHRRPSIDAQSELPDQETPSLTDEEQQVRQYIAKIDQEWAQVNKELADNPTLEWSAQWLRMNDEMGSIKSQAIRGDITRVEALRLVLELLKTRPRLGVDPTEAESTLEHPIDRLSPEDQKEVRRLFYNIDGLRKAIARNNERMDELRNGKRIGTPESLTEQRRINRELEELLRQAKQGDMSATEAGMRALEVIKTAPD